MWTLLLLLLISVSLGVEHVGFVRVVGASAVGVPGETCESKQDERLWYAFMSKHYEDVFPDGNRNFGGTKWCEP